MKDEKCGVGNAFGGFSSLYSKLHQNNRRPRLRWFTQVITVLYTDKQYGPRYKMENTWEGHHI
jgi:hypothetical protein